MERAVLILDSEKYKEKQNEYSALMSEKFSEVEIIYTEYEDELIRKVRSIKGVGKALQHLLYWKKSFNYARDIAKICKTSAVICLNPIVGTFLGLMNKKNIFELYLCGFLFEPKNNKIYYNLRKKVVMKVIGNVKKIIVYSSKEIEYYNKIFSSEKFVFLHYGIDYDETCKYSGNLPQEYFFSGGGSNRDYEVLFSAVNKLDVSTPLVVATHPHCIAGLDVGKNIVVKNDVVNETFGDVMKKSKFLVLALKDAEISAGHMVILQALKNNIPVLVNRIKAVEDYVSEKEVYFYESGNINELSVMIKNLCNESVNRNTSDYYSNHYTFKCLLKRLIDLV